MSVLDDDLAAFDRHIEQQEVGTVEPAEPVEETTEEEVATPDAEEAAIEEPPAAVVETPVPTRSDRVERTEEERFTDYLSRFGATDAALADLPPELQKTIRAGFEADGMVGRQGRENGLLKKAIDELRESVEASRPQPQTPEPYDVDDLRDRLLENPTAIEPMIKQAWLEGRRDLVLLGVNVLSEVNGVLAEGYRADIAKQDALAAMNEQIGPHIAAAEQATFKNTLDYAVATTAASFPDFYQYSEQIMHAVTEDPELARGLVEGTPEQGASVLASLYKIAAFDATRQDGSTLAAATATAAAEQAKESEAAKKEGFVATGAQRVESEKKTSGEQWLEDLGFDAAAAKYYAD